MSRPGLLIAGTHSGCGKTTLTLGIMAALVRRGLAVAPFKCGPDFIDPSLHQVACGRKSRNLDVRMCGRSWVRHCFARHSAAADISVVEGVMGLFDGGAGSAATLAKTLALPVVLVIDCRSQAESVAAVVHGFATLDPEVRLVGVIANRIGSDRHRALVTEAVKNHCQVPILGFLPRREEISIPSRHLGLHMGEETPLGSRGLVQLADLVERNLDCDLLLRLAARPGSTDEPATAAVQGGIPVRIGVARDAAFCFYYQDNLDLLAEAGAHLVEFSPLNDAELPPDLHGLYLGGGYPELHARTLGANERMRRQILAFAVQGGPVYGECGGFMYLAETIVDLEGNSHPMAGVYPLTARMEPRLRSLGYRQVTLRRDCLLGLAGTQLHGHEFHYSTVENIPAELETAFRLEDGRAEGYSMHHTLAGYVHLHWGRTPEAARRFVDACRRAGGLG